MNQLHSIFAAAILLALSCSATAQQRPSTGRFGVVNTERIMRDAIPSQRAQKSIESEFQKRDQELAKSADQLKRLQDELAKNAVTMSETQRRSKEREFGDLNRDFERRKAEFGEDLNQRRNEAMGQIIERANAIIRQIAEQEKYDIIFQDAVYVSPRIDITDKVIEALNKSPSPAGK